MAPGKFIYLDYNATTPVRPEVFEAMRPYLTDDGAYGNPSSLHAAGQTARAALENARERVASFLGAGDPSEIIFTSCGTESNNTAIQGAAFAHRSKGTHLITSVIEHHAVLHVFDYLEKEHGFQVTRLPVDEHGRIRPADLEKAFRPDTILVSLMAANNEIGTVEPIQELGELCRARRVLFHTDAVQSAGKIPVDVKAWPVDMLTISGHKLYAPKGVGALYIRKGVKLHALLHGGTHEKNRRAGTENVAGAAGLGEACALAAREIPREEPRVRSLRDRLEKGLLKRVPYVRVNGHPTERLANTTNLTFECVEGEGLVLALDQAGFALHKTDLPGLACSTGSACASGMLEPSHVLTAIGVPRHMIHGTVRFSLGLFSTEADVDAALEIVPPVVEKLRNMSPLWEDKMAEEKARR
ncbi:MAG: cysteine desulfurase NifS [Elusimicrobiota bacterium]